MVCSKTRWGWRVEAEAGGHVVLVKGKPVSHLLHFFLGVFTCSAWWFVVWLPLTVFGGEQRISVAEDAAGQAFVVRTMSDYLKYALVGLVILGWMIAVSSAAGRKDAPAAAASAGLIPVADQLPASASERKTVFRAGT